MVRKFLGVVFIIFVLVAPHELAHLVAAKSLGVGVYRASIGFGPVVGCVWIGGTESCLSAIPLGGYVALADESAVSSFSDQELLRLRIQHPAGFKELTDSEGWLTRQPLSTRFCISLAGVMGNFLFVLSVLPWLFRAASAQKLSLGSYNILEQEAGGREFVGPVGLFKMAVRAGEKGFATLVLLSVRFSIGIAVLQLFPLPFFDGSHIVGAAVTAIVQGMAIDLVAMFSLSYLTFLLYRRCIFGLLRLHTLLEVQRQSHWSRLQEMLRGFFR